MYCKSNSICKFLLSINLPSSTLRRCSQRRSNVALPLRNKKPKSTRNTIQYFVDLKSFRAMGGTGGDGCTSFLSLWSNEHAGPDGGDGGNGGHVILAATRDINDLINVASVLRAGDGDKGRNRDRHGSNASHLIVNVPVGTIIKNAENRIVADLEREGLMFVAARGGAGGKGNHYFISDVEQAPEVCEYGALGEDLAYTAEVRSMAHIGLIGFPNAGKSTLLRAISRARPKVAPYPFTTLKPHLGMIRYDDYEQLAVADLPGLIPDSHKNRGLGIQFLRHAERCMALLYVIDVSLPEPWQHLAILRNELLQFSASLLDRPQLVIANKTDLAESENNVELLRQHTDLRIIPISAKLGVNLEQVLREIRILYDDNNNIDISKENDKNM